MCEEEEGREDWGEQLDNDTIDNLKKEIVIFEFDDETFKKLYGRWL
jgi:hypothetical protein